MANKDEKKEKEATEKQSSSQENEPVESKSTGSDKVRKQAEHESGISRGSIVTPNSNSTGGRDI